MSDALRTRREFIRQGLALAAVGATAPSFLTRSAQAAPAGDDRILVVLQLAGGNDGLNTLVPFADDAYYRGRPTLGVPAAQVLRLDGHHGLHPGLAPLKSLYDDGRVALVQGVGYPNPNRSHFRAMEIWETAADSEQVLTTGWLGRWFDATCTGPASDPAIGLQLGRRQTPAFANQHSLGITLGSPADYRFASGDARQQATFAALNEPVAGQGEALDFLSHTALNARLSAAEVQRVGTRRFATPAYPQSKLGHDLQLVGQMIAGGLPTRVYFVTLGGFDTHAQQAATHADLMTELGEALAAFDRDLRAQRNDGRVLLLAFSEFGRRVQENGSKGTDHGAAGPMFLLGPAVKPGLHGRTPSLTELDRGDLRHTVDFRAVYGEVLDRWLDTPAQSVLGRRYPALGLLTTQPARA